MSKIIVYGIPNCDITKKTLSWFKKNDITVTFHDYKMLGVTKEKLSAWIEKAGLDTILNKRSTTWRALPVAEQEKITTPAAAIRLMMENNSIIKRPVIETADKLLAGYNEPALVKQFLDQ